VLFRSVSSTASNKAAKLPEDLYGSFAALLDAVEETFMRAGASREASECFKEVLSQAVDRLMEIGGITSE